MSKFDLGRISSTVLPNSSEVQTVAILADISGGYSQANYIPTISEYNKLFGGLDDSFDYIANQLLSIRTHLVICTPWTDFDEFNYATLRLSDNIKISYPQAGKKYTEYRELLPDYAEFMYKDVMTVGFKLDFSKVKEFKDGNYIILPDGFGYGLTLYWFRKNSLTPPVNPEFVNNQYPIDITEFDGVIDEIIKGLKFNGWDIKDNTNGVIIISCPEPTQNLVSFELDGYYQDSVDFLNYDRIVESTVGHEIVDFTSKINGIKGKDISITISGNVNPNYQKLIVECSGYQEEYTFSMNPDDDLFLDNILEDSKLITSKTYRINEKIDPGTYKLSRVFDVIHRDLAGWQNAIYKLTDEFDIDFILDFGIDSLDYKLQIFNYAFDNDLLILSNYKPESTKEVLSHEIIKYVYGSSIYEGLVIPNNFFLAYYLLLSQYSFDLSNGTTVFHPDNYTELYELGVVFIDELQNYGFYLDWINTYDKSVVDFITYFLLNKIRRTLRTELKLSAIGSSDESNFRVAFNNAKIRLLSNNRLINSLDAVSITRYDEYLTLSLNIVINVKARKRYSVNVDIQWSNA